MKTVVIDISRNDLSYEMECLKLFLIFAVTGYCVEAAFIVRPTNWNSGSGIHSAGVGGPVAWRRPHIGYHPWQIHYPPTEFDDYGHQGRTYPQTPTFPIFRKQNNYPQFGNNFPTNNLPPTTLEQDDMNRGIEQPKTTIEQDDMNRGIEGSEENILDSDLEEDYNDNVILDNLYN